MGPRCSSAETQVCHRSYILLNRGDCLIQVITWASFTVFYNNNFIQCSILPRRVEGIYKEYIQTTYTSQIDKDIVTTYKWNESKLIYIHTNYPFSLQLCNSKVHYIKEVEDEFHFFFRCKNNHTLRNILYKDVNGICPKFNEYDRAKKLQLILPSKVPQLDS
jgi:hypothetical protein